MTVKVKDLMIVTGITLLLLFLLEKASRHILESRSNAETEKAFRRQVGGKDLDMLNDCCSYRETDPLLGWAMTGDQLESKGWKVTNNCIRLEHIPPGSRDTLVIFITGGSTSDLGLDADSWPLSLSEKLKARHVSHIIYNGAVGAYGSSQELLKLIRDGLPLKPDIHISYCGANEYQNPYFVSPYEHNFYRKAMQQAQYPPLMTHTVQLILETMGVDNDYLTLKDFPLSDGIENWGRNMANMKALAAGHGYRFIGILQPVVGFGQVKDTKRNPDIQPLLEEYRIFYPGALEALQEAPYIHDFTHLFDDVGDKAFRDDCHLYPEYQDRVAEKIDSLMALP